MLSSDNSADIGKIVNIHVQRSPQNPHYSIFREENTRQTSEACQTGTGSGASPRVMSNGPLLHFLSYNTKSVERTISDFHAVPGTVVLVGGTGFYGKFLAEQYLRRGISVTVLTGDAEKAKQIFVPIASGDADRHNLQSSGYIPLSLHKCRHLQLAEDNRNPARGTRIMRYKNMEGSTLPASSTTMTGVSGRNPVTLEIVEGSLGSICDVECAVRQASVVYFLASAEPGLRFPFRWWRSSSDRLPSTCEVVDQLGFLRVLDASNRVDAHFVALTPLWIHSSWLSPIYWYRRCVSYPSGYCSSIIKQHQILLGSGDGRNRRLHFRDDDWEADRPVWRYWWSILSSSKLPEDRMERQYSFMRFTIFRLSDLVFTSFHERCVAVMSTHASDGKTVPKIATGDLDARLTANMLVKSLGLCRSVFGSCIDVGGRRFDGVDMKDAAAMLDLFDRF